MPLPTPQLGLVVRYGFVWAGKDRRPPDDLEAVIEPSLGERKVLRVTYLPISHTPPREGEQAIVIPPRVAQHLGLTALRSYIYTSYAGEHDWPFDVERIPRSGDRFDHGLIPPKLFAAVVADFAAYLASPPRLCSPAAGIGPLISYRTELRMTHPAGVARSDLKRTTGAVGDKVVDGREQARP